jgi:hypothetical protein
MSFLLDPDVFQLALVHAADKQGVVEPVVTECLQVLPLVKHEMKEKFIAIYIF